MKEQFNLYAQYYDLLYQDKDYKKEAEYVHSLIQKYNPEAKTILSLGCGTGKYERELEKFGYDVVGVDISQQMIDIAVSNNKKLNCKFLQGDIRSIMLDKKFDVIISLFHVICYQTTGNDLLKAFKTVNYHLNKNGLFLFDYWNGSAVLTDPPVVRKKHMENSLISVDRVANPTMHKEKNTVDIMFHLEIFDKKSENIYKFDELHRMRYFFLTEFDLLSELTGLKLQANKKWMHLNDNLDSSSWYGVTIFQKD